MSPSSFSAAVLTQDPELRARVTAALELAGANLQPSPTGADVALLDMRLPIFRKSLGPLTQQGTQCIGVSVTAPSGNELVELLSLGLAGWVDCETPAEDLARELISVVASGRRGQDEPEESGADLHEAIERTIAERAFSIVLQPVCDLGSGSILALESRARFIGVDGRAPDVWLALAEREGLRVPLELALAEAALALVPELPATTSLLLNIGADALLEHTLHELVREHAAGRVILKLNQHQTVGDYEELSEAISALRRLGVWLAIDDSGSGLHSLARLAQLRPDFLMLDSALVRSVDREPVRRALARALASFASDIGAEVVAEGIETTAELATLSELGVRLGQGHLLAAPTALADVPEGPLAVPTSADDGGYTGPRIALPKDAEGNFLATAQAVIRFLRAQMPDSSVIISQLDYTGHRVGVVAAGGPVQSLLQPGVMLPQEETAEYWLASGRAPRMCPDVDADPVYGALKISQHPGFCSFIGTALELIDGTRFGTLTLIDGRPNAYSAADLAMLEELAVELERALLAETSGMDRGELAKHLRGLAQTDSITGVLTQTGLMEAVSSTLHRPPADGTRRYFVRVEIEGLPELVEKSGRTVAELTLKALATTMRDVARPGDMIGRHGEGRLGAILLARRSGDAEAYIEALVSRSASFIEKRHVDVRLRCGFVDLAEVERPDQIWSAAGTRMPAAA